MSIKATHSYSWPTTDGEAHAQVNRVEDMTTHKGEVITHTIQISLSSTICAIIAQDAAGNEFRGTVCACDVDDAYEFDELFDDIYRQHKTYMESGDCKCAGCGIDLSDDVR